MLVSQPEANLGREADLRGINNQISGLTNQK